MKDLNLIIVRGLPNAGKTTFASLLGKAICSADDYFMINGEYKWTETKIGTAHKWCQRKCELFLKYKISTVIVANTTVRKNDLEPYFKLASNYGYNVTSVILENYHENKNNHNVPKDVIEKMKNNFYIHL